MRNINQLFPGFARGDFAVLYGSQFVLSLSSLLCVRAQLPTQLGGLGSDVVFVDGGNTFRLYQVARLAQLHQLNPKEVLERIYISRAFTAYQMTSLIMEKLKETVKRYDAKLVIISDIAGFFLDKDIPDEEARRVFSQVTAYLSTFAKENQHTNRHLSSASGHKTKQFSSNGNLWKSKRSRIPQTNKVRPRTRFRKASPLRFRLCGISIRESHANRVYGGLPVVGKTVESYRMALEDEIHRWNGFAKALRTEDREAFEALMDACRSYASAGSNATQPILFEPMIMSILLNQQKKLHRLERAIDAIKQQSSQP